MRREFEQGYNYASFHARATFFVERREPPYMTSTIRPANWGDTYRVGLSSCLPEPGHAITCCLVSLKFLCDILNISPVLFDIPTPFRRHTCKPLNVGTTWRLQIAKGDDERKITMRENGEAHLSDLERARDGSWEGGRELFPTWWEPDSSLSHSKC